MLCNSDLTIIVCKGLSLRLRYDIYGLSSFSAQTAMDFVVVVVYTPPPVAWRWSEAMDFADVEAFLHRCSYCNII